MEAADMQFDTMMAGLSDIALLELKEVMTKSPCHVFRCLSAGDVAEEELYPSISLGMINREISRRKNHKVS